VDAILTVEMFSDGTPKRNVPSILRTPAMQWCARIKGFGKRYKFEREFLRGITDWTNANSRGTRGARISWILEPGELYEVKYKTSWRSEERYFCYVHEGEIAKLSEGEAERWVSTM
jgi:hypothetical protein